MSVIIDNPAHWVLSDSLNFLLPVYFNIFYELVRDCIYIRVFDAYSSFKGLKNFFHIIFKR